MSRYGFNPEGKFEETTFRSLSFVPNPSKIMEILSKPLSRPWVPTDTRFVFPQSPQDRENCEQLSQFGNSPVWSGKAFVSKRTNMQQTVKVPSSTSKEILPSDCHLTDLLVVAWPVVESVSPS